MDRVSTHGRRIRRQPREAAAPRQLERVDRRAPLERRGVGGATVRLTAPVGVTVKGALAVPRGIVTVRPPPGAAPIGTVSVSAARRSVIATRLPLAS
jgi:hypothetical protein